MKTKAGKIITLCISVICLIGIGSLFSYAINISLPFQSRGGSALAAPVNEFASAETTLYLPAVIQNYPHKSVFGIQLTSVSEAEGADQMQQAGAYWIRRNGLLWSDVESTQGVRDWSTVNSLADELKNASSRGMNVILVVRSAPAWAANQNCGPVNSSQFSAFGSFLAEAVSRFSRPPYNVLNYEIWNEPDVDPSSVKSTEVFGCWGDKNDTYFGGAHYGNMLNVVYPMMKAANPDAQIVIGGLLFDCNPAQPSLCGGDLKSGNFLEGILRATQGKSFDGIAFHAYDYFGDPGNIGKFANLSWGSAWNNDVGPVVNAKTTFIKSLLNSYHVSGKFLMNTESALVDVPQNCVNCEETKANYLAQSFASAKRQGLFANVWYSYYGWRGSQLATSAQSTLPAYTAYDVAQDQLADATFLQAITTYANVNVLAFNRDNKQVWLIWSKDGANHLITLPKVPLEILDVYGASSTPIDANFNVTIQPHYLIFPQ